MTAQHRSTFNEPSHDRPVIACPECSELAGIMTHIDADGWRHAKICATCHGWGQVQETRNGSAYLPVPFWVHSATPPGQFSDARLGNLWRGVLAATDPAFLDWTLSHPSDRPRVAWLALPATPAAVRDFRGFLRDTLAAWTLHDVSEDAATVVSELATNALSHGAAPLADGATMPIDLIMSCGDKHLMTVVTDPGRHHSPGAQPALMKPGPYAETGRGLLIVDTLADSWGWARLPGGRTAVWAIFNAG